MSAKPFHFSYLVKSRFVVLKLSLNPHLLYQIMEALIMLGFTDCPALQKHIKSLFLFQEKLLVLLRIGQMIPCGVFYLHVHIVLSFLCWLPQKHRRRRSKDFSGGAAICQIRPHVFFPNDHGHTVMYLDHRFVGRAREDCKAVRSVNELVDPAEVNRLHGVHCKQILCFFPVVMAPLIKAGGREDHTPIAQAVGKGFLFRCRFRTRIDNQLVILEARKTEARRNSDDLPMLIYHSRDNIAGKNLTRFVLSGIVLLHVLVDRIQLFVLADAGKVVSAAHIVSPNVSHRETQYLDKPEFAIS